MMSMSLFPGYGMTGPDRGGENRLIPGYYRAFFEHHHGD